MDTPHIPLTGIRVLETATLLPGPWAGRILAELGAEVVKVEHPSRGDEMRFWGENKKGVGLLAVGIGLALIFHSYRMEALAALALTAVFAALFAVVVVLGVLAHTAEQQRTEAELARDRARAAAAIVP